MHPGRRRKTERARLPTGGLSLRGRVWRQGRGPRIRTALGDRVSAQPHRANRAHSGAGARPEAHQDEAGAGGQVSGQKCSRGPQLHPENPDLGEAVLMPPESQEVQTRRLHSPAGRRLPLLRSRAARTGSGNRGPREGEEQSVAERASANAERSLSARGVAWA